MKVINNKYGKIIHVNNKPVVVEISGLYITRYESHGRWFARIIVNQNDTLEKIYTLLQMHHPIEMIIKLPYRYNRFTCYVSRDTVASSVYDILPDDPLVCKIEMTNAGTTDVCWKFNDINVLPVVNACNE